MTNKKVCEIKSPKLPIRGYSAKAKYINLKAFVEKGLKKPDFGFDTHDIDPLKADDKVINHLSQVCKMT